MTRFRTTEKDYVKCPGCGLLKSTFAGPVCGACDRAAQRAKQLERQARQEAQRARGCVGDEHKTKAAMASFDAFSRQVREAAGCPSGGRR